MLLFRDAIQSVRDGTMVGYGRARTLVDLWEIALKELRDAESKEECDRIIDVSLRDLESIKAGFVEARLDR